MCVAAKKRAAFWNPVKNRVLESYSNIFFPVELRQFKNDSALTKYQWVLILPRYLATIKYRWVETLDFVTFSHAFLWKCRVFIWNNFSLRDSIVMSENCIKDSCPASKCDEMGSLDYRVSAGICYFSHHFWHCADDCEFYFSLLFLKFFLDVAS